MNSCTSSEASTGRRTVLVVVVTEVVADRHQQSALVAEVPEQEGLRTPSPLGDAARGDGGIALLREQLDRGRRHRAHASLLVPARGPELVRTGLLPCHGVPPSVGVQDEREGLEGRAADVQVDEDGARFAFAPAERCRSGVHDGTRRLADDLVAMMMAERDVVPVERCELGGRDRRRVMGGPTGLERQAVAGDDAPPPRGLRGHTFQRPEAPLVFDHGPAPHHDIRGRDLDHRPCRVVEDHHPCAPFGRAEPLVHGDVVERIVIADEQHDGSFGAVELLRGPGQEIVGDPRVVEQVASDEDRVDICVDRVVDRPFEGALLEPGATAPDPEMHVGQVKDRGRTHIFSVANIYGRPEAAPGPAVARRLRSDGVTTRRIGLLADTHIPECGPDLPDAAYDALEGCDQILHCGDLHTIDVVNRLERLAPTIAARGNGDTFGPRARRPGVAEDPRIVDAFVAEVGGLRIGLTHDLAHAEGRSDDDVARILLRQFGGPVSIAVSGHTHVPMVWGLADGTALVNPGSATMPYGYLGIAGTVGFIDIDDDAFEVTILDLRTGGVELELAGPGSHPLERGARPTGGR